MNDEWPYRALYHEGIDRPPPNPPPVDLDATNALRARCGWPPLNKEDVRRFDSAKRARLSEEGRQPEPRPRQSDLQDTLFEPLPTNIIPLSGILVAALNIIFVETESSHLMDVSLFLFLRNPCWITEQHARALSELRITIPGTETSLPLSEFLARRPLQFAHMVLRANETENFSEFPETIINDLGTGVYRSREDPNIVTTDPDSSDGNGPIQVPRRVISDGWANPSNTPPELSEANHNSTSIQINEPPSLRVAIRDPRIRSRCKKYVKWRKEMQSIAEMLIPSNDAIIGIAKGNLELAQLQDATDFYDVRRREKLQNAITATSLVLNALHEWLWGDKIEALRIHTQLVSQYRTDPHGEHYSELIGIGQRYSRPDRPNGALEFTDTSMHGMLSRARQDYPSSFLQCARYADAHLPRGWQHQDRHSQLNMSDNELREIIDTIYHACHVQHNDRWRHRVTGIFRKYEADYSRNARLRWGLKPFYPIFREFDTGPPHKLYVPLHDPYGEHNPCGRLYPFAYAPTVLLERNQPQSTWDDTRNSYYFGSFYLLPIDNTYTAAATTWNLADPNCNSVCEYIRHIAWYTAPLIRRLPTVTHLEEIIGHFYQGSPVLSLRVTHDSRDSREFHRDNPRDPLNSRNPRMAIYNASTWPFNEHPSGHSLRALDGETLTIRDNVIGPTIDYPAQTEYQWGYRTRPPRVTRGAFIDHVEYPSLTFQDYRMEPLAAQQPPDLDNDEQPLDILDNIE